MNPRLALLHPYPFEKLDALFAGVAPAAVRPIRLSIGEPQHPAPALVTDALAAHRAGISVYPLTAGLPELRRAIATWLEGRYGLPRVDPAAQVLPVNGTREALFAFAQCIVDARSPNALVASPNPFYQIYEGAALLAGASTAFLNQTRENGFTLETDQLSADEWSRVQLLYVCSPGNPTGRVLPLDEWRTLFDLSDEHGFAIASDECYSEIYSGDDGPLGGLQASRLLGRDDYRRVVVFGSLSKRSNVPGLRSGYAAGDAALLRAFLRYRTYHGSAMSLAVQHASIAAWRDEAHVLENRAAYRRKFDTVLPMLEGVLDAPRPEAGFYLWARVPGGDDEAFARALYRDTHVTVLPGRYLARDAHGANPGVGFVRIALVPAFDDCVEAVQRVVQFCSASTATPLRSTS